MIKTIWKEGVVCLMGYILPVDNNIAKNYAQRMMKTEKEPLKLDKIKKIDLNTEQIQINYDKRDRKSTRLNSSHVAISYAVFCLKKKTKKLIHKTMSSQKGKN